VHTEPRAARLFEIKVVRRGPVTSVVLLKLNYHPLKQVGLKGFVSYGLKFFTHELVIFPISR